VLLSRRIRVFAYCEPVDMRKSFNTLAALVKQMGQDLLKGDAFLFVSRRRNRAKVLWFDGTGLCLLAKRLEKGKFAAAWERAGEFRMAESESDSKAESPMTVSELSLYLEGCELVGKQRLSPPEYVHEIDGRVFENARKKQGGMNR
jgi:transposase